MKDRVSRRRFLAGLLASPVCAAIGAKAHLLLDMPAAALRPIVSRLGLVDIICSQRVMKRRRSLVLRAYLERNPIWSQVEETNGEEETS